MSGYSASPSPSLVPLRCRLAQKCEAFRPLAWSSLQRRTHCWREVDSNHQYRVTRLRFREGVISGGLVWAAERAVPRPHKQKALMPPSGTRFLAVALGLAV